MIEHTLSGLNGEGRRTLPETTEKPGWLKPPPAARHAVQFYMEDAQIERAIARFAASALAAGDAVLIAATPEHRARVARLLLGEIPLSQARCVVYLDAATLLAECLIAGRPNQARFDEVIGNAVGRALTLAPRVAIYGELVALLSAEGKHDQALELERFWHDLLARAPASLLCGYDMQSFASMAHGDAFRYVCDAHNQVFPVEEPLGTDDEQRRRSTALLQHRLHALESEAEERERALVARNEELLAALGARDQFLMTAAHELKTPITSLRVYAQLLQRDAVNGKAIAADRLEVALQAIERQTGQIKLLVDRLLDIGQIDSGSLRLALAPGDLVALTRDALAQFERGATHQILLVAPDSLAVSVDPVRFEQVITILLANAVKFSPAGSTVTVEIAETDDGAAQLAVTDEGRGVSPEHRGLIFERFQQAHGRHYQAGLGLSLPIARRIVELHGGSIHVEPAPSGGARFVTRLPGAPRI